MYDCVIVGAGPAGSTAAYHLAKQGHSVLLLDKAPLGRYKACSGAVSPTIAQWFDFDLTPAIDRSVRRVRYTWKLEDEICSALTTPDPLWVLDREVFDRFLVQQVQALGAAVKAETPVTGIERVGDRWQVHTPQATFEAQYLVAADGAEGPTAGWLGFKPHKARPAAVLEITTDRPMDEDSALNFEFGLVKNACLWGVPKRQGYTLGAVLFVGNNVQDLQPGLEAYAVGLGLGGHGQTFHTHPLQLWDGDRPLHCERALLVGEAAALVDPMSVEGIRPGIFSGVKAAAAIHSALAGNAEALPQYTQTLQIEWGTDMQWAQRIASIFFRVPGLGYRVGVKRPSATERLGQILAGEVRYRDIANRVLKRLSTGFMSGRNSPL
ncbi:MAG: geranylgeranyl reductase family protein [Cyanobacteria bacterium]|nr:geranylgeranyl reductase family protein [Cyanobacteriota bacterium]